MTRRARKVLPFAGRGEATMNTPVHGRACGSAALRQVVADRRKHGLAMAQRHVRGLLQGLQPCNSPRRSVRPTPLTVTYARNATITWLIVPKNESPPRTKSGDGRFEIMR